MSRANLVIEIYCLLITIILLICNFLSARNNKASSQSQIMGLMLTVNGGIIFAFIVTVLVEGNAGYEVLNTVMTGICYALGALLTELFGEYVFSIVRTVSAVSRKVVLGLRIVCGMAMGLDILSIFNGMYFGTVNGYHTRGPCFLFNQSLILLVMAAELIYVLLRIRELGSSAAVLAMYSFFPLVSIVLQIFIRNYVLMYPAITLSLFIIYVVTYINQANILHQKNEELKKAIRELELAKKEAEKANRAKSEFLTSMSHDIRTPLNAIIGMTAMAMDHVDHRKQVLDDLSVVQSSSKHLLSLVNDVLDLSMIESGKMTIAQNDFILPDLLAEVEKIAWPLTKAKNQSFSVTADSLTHEFYIGDMPRMKQILVNFISNAVKYTPSGGVIRLQAEEEPAEEPNQVVLRFSCIDNGIGIGTERQKAIFEPFYREVKSTVNPVEGTGLGLTIVRNIAEAMHGQVELTSEKGRGSVFTVILPMRLADEEKMLRQFDNVRDYRVLLVADNQELCRSFFKNYREKIGNACSVMDNEEVLADQWDPLQTYDVILIVSEKNPAEVTEKVRRQYPDTDIVYGSSMQMLAEEECILSAGADAVLYRPIFRASLFEEYQALRLRKTTAAGTDQYLAGRRILVAEDQPINYAVVQYILENAGASVSRAENGREAVDQFLASEPGEYDLILMDIMMPVMNGYDAAAAIRSADRKDAAAVVIVAMTANAFSEDIQKSLASGMDGHISKPVEPAVVRETLIRIFGSRK